MLQDSPVPVDLPTVAKIKSPMALDVYWWLTKRYYNMHYRVSIKWQKLYDQFGSDSAMNQFRRNFKQAVAEVLEVYPAARITCGREYVTLWPSQTSVPTVAQTCIAEHASARTVDAQIKDAERAVQAEERVQERRKAAEERTERELAAERARAELDAYKAAHDGLTPFEVARRSHDSQAMPDDRMEPGIEPTLF